MLQCMCVCSWHLFQVEKTIIFFSPLLLLDKFKYSSHSKQQLVFHIAISIRKCMQQLA